VGGCGARNPSGPPLSGCTHVTSVNPRYTKGLVLAGSDDLPIRHDAINCLRAIGYGRNQHAQG
jgi:hypothetical protein